MAVHGVANEQAEGFFVIDKTHRIVQWSDGAAALIGLASECAVGHPCYEAVRGKETCGNFYCRPSCPALGALEQGRSMGRALLRIQRDGSPWFQLKCELSALPSPPGGAVIRLCPVSRPRPVAMGRSQAAAFPPSGLSPGIVRDLCALARLTTSLSVESPERGLGLALEIVRETSGAEAVEVFLAEPGGRGMVLTGHCGLFRNAFFQITRFRPDEGFPGLVLTSQRPVLTNSLSADPRFLRRRVVERGFRSYLNVPFFGPNGPMGSLGVAFRRSHPNLEVALRLLSWAGSSLSLMLQGRTQRLWYELSVAGCDKPEDQGEGLDTLLRQTLRRAVTSGKAQGGAIVVLNPETGRLFRRLEEGPLSGGTCRTLEVSAPGDCPALSGNQGIVLHGARGSRPLSCRQASRQGEVSYCLPMVVRHGPLDTFTTEGAHSLAALPAAKTEAVGVLRIGYQGPGPAPPTQHLVKLLGITEYAAQPIRGAMIHQQEQQRMEGLHRRLVQVGSGAPEPLPVYSPALNDGRPDTQAAFLPYLDIRCFGRFELFRHEELVTPDMTPRRKALTLLKILLTHEGRPVPKDTLIELLWPEVPPGTGLSRLYMVVHALRRLVEPPGCKGKWVFIRTDGDCYYFDTSVPSRTDVKEFKDLVRTGRKAEASGNIAAAISAYEAATKVYRGDYLEDEAFADWCWAEREHLRETCLDILAHLSARYAQQGAPDRSIACYRQALRLDPAREQNHQGLMRALFTLGRRDEALRQYGLCRDILRRELDIAPLPETERLYLQIRDADRNNVNHNGRS